MTNIKSKVPVEVAQYCIVIDKDSNYYKNVVFTRTKEGNYYSCDNGCAYLEKDLLPIIGNEFTFYIRDEIITDTAIDYFYFYDKIVFSEYEIHIDRILLDNISSKNKLTNFNFY